jgi:hypothetical protein
LGGILKMALARNDGSPSPFILSPEERKVLWDESRFTVDDPANLVAGV